MTRDYAEAVSSKKLTESEVMEQHRNLVMWVYNRMRHRLSDAAEPDDYLQEGYVGLLLAWRKWNPDRGEFSTYAVSIIRRAMLLTDRRVRRQLGYHVSWEQGIGSDAEVTIGDTVADEHSAADLSWAEWSTVDWNAVARRILTRAQYRVWRAYLTRTVETARELSCELNMPKSTVQHHLSNAQARFRAWRDNPHATFRQPGRQAMPELQRRARAEAMGRYMVSRQASLQETGQAFGVGAHLVEKELRRLNQWNPGLRALVESVFNDRRSRRPQRQSG